MTQEYQQSPTSGQQTYGAQPTQQSGHQQSTGQMGHQSMGQTSQQPTGQSQRMQGQTGGQMGGAHRTTHQQVGQQFEAEITPELNEALESFDRVVEIASWCADKCIESGPQMAECARLCDDLSELAELNEKLIARDSINGPEVAETFLRIARQGMPILQQHQQSPHVQETFQAVNFAIDSTEKLLKSIGGPQEAAGQQGFQELTESHQSQGQQTQTPQPQSFQGGQSY
ncbi:hypothetical protein [Halorussus marinus]|uniref:hypothetical protein n=1 Tax=Halorussus marinus TaxID=2505976 RepID=UPI00106DFDC8|nr:hypothetical protein [Halorussus marinus]